MTTEVRKAPQHPCKERGDAEGMLWALRLGWRKPYWSWGRPQQSNLHAARVQASYRRATAGLHLPTALRFSVSASSPAGMFICCLRLAPICHPGHPSPSAKQEPGYRWNWSAMNCPVRIPG